MSINWDFSGKVVLITGSSRGIGAITAKTFSRAGAQVVVTGPESEKQNISKVAQECTELSSKRLKPLEVVADLTVNDDCIRLIDSTIKYFGKLDILVNNAGIVALDSIENDSIIDIFDRIMAVNMRSVVYLTHLAVKHLEITKGVIINNASIAGLKAFKDAICYSMSKSAVDMFTKCLSATLGPKGIRVNAISPTYLRTNIFRESGVPEEDENQLFEKVLNIQPLSTVGEPQDIANSILYLASEQSSFVSGINLVSDGGLLSYITV